MSYECEGLCILHFEQETNDNALYYGLLELRLRAADT